MNVVPFAGDVPGFCSAHGMLNLVVMFKGFSEEDMVWQVSVLHCKRGPYDRKN